MVKYSVVIPAYNSAGTLRHCLNALTLQSVNAEDYEVIVVDDGSADNTKDTVKNFPVKYLWQTNHGPASARNHGAKKAAGEIVLFTDADCIPADNWIKEMTAPFTDPMVIAVKGAYKTEQRSMTARFAQLEFEERFEILKKTDRIDMVDTYSAAFRKNVFWEHDGFDETFPVANNEDTDLSYKLSSAGCKMVFNPLAIVCHLRHPDSPYKYLRQKFWRGFWRMMVYRRYPKKMVSDSYTPQTLKLQIVFLSGALLFFMFSMALKATMLPALLLSAAFLLSTMPFLLFGIKRDFAAGLLSPFFLAIRACSIGGGILYFLFSRAGRRTPAVK